MRKIKNEIFFSKILDVASKYGIREEKYYILNNLENCSLYIKNEILNGNIVFTDGKTNVIFFENNEIHSKSIVDFIAQDNEEYKNKSREQIFNILKNKDIFETSPKEDKILYTLIREAYIHQLKKEHKLIYNLNFDIKYSYSDNEISFLSKLMYFANIKNGDVKARRFIIKYIGRVGNEVRKDLLSDEDMYVSNGDQKVLIIKKLGNDFIIKKSTLSDLVQPAIKNIKTSNYSREKIHQILKSSTSSTTLCRNVISMLDREKEVINRSKVSNDKEVQPWAKEL